MKCNSMVNRETLTGLIHYNFNQIKRIWKTELICLENNNICSYLTNKEQSRLRKLRIKKKKFFKKSKAWALTANPFSIPLLPLHYNCRSFYEPISTGGVILPDDLPILFGYGFKGRDMDLEIRSCNQLIHSEDDYADIQWVEPNGDSLRSYMEIRDSEIHQKMGACLRFKIDLDNDDYSQKSKEIDDNTDWGKIINLKPSTFNIEDLSIDKEDDLTGHGIVFKDGHTMIVKDYPIDCSVELKERELSFNTQDLCNKMIKPVIEKILNKGKIK